MRLLTPRVSIVLPVRDAATTVVRAVQSCLDQTCESFEVIAVDDGSSDGTSALLAAFDDQRLSVYRLEGSGDVIRAAATACEFASGELFCRMDADDWMHPERLTKQIALLDARPEVAACGSLVKIAPTDDSEVQDGFRSYEKWLNSLVEPEAIARERFIESPIANPTAMMRREALEEIGGYRETPGRWAEDYDLWLRFLDRGMSLAKVPEVLLRWNDLPDRLTRADDRYAHEKFLEAKAHYLAKIPAVRDTGTAICGAGPIGKRTARFLQAEGVKVHAFYEVSDRRIGERIAGIPVLAQSEFGSLVTGDAVVLGAVGLPAAREKIRRIVRPRGFIEGEDFFCVA